MVMYMRRILLGLSPFPRTISYPHISKPGHLLLKTARARELFDLKAE